MQRFFAVTPPSVHQMVLTLERQSFISRTPGTARSIRLRIDPEILPKLQPVIPSVQRYKPIMSQPSTSRSSIARFSMQ